MTTDRKFLVAIEWDPEASVWYVANSDVPGLATEAPTIDAMLEKLKIMVPELLELNGVIDAKHSEVPFSLTTEVGNPPRHY